MIGGKWWSAVVCSTLWIHKLWLREQHCPCVTVCLWVLLVWASFSACSVGLHNIWILKWGELWEIICVMRCITRSENVTDRKAPDLCKYFFTAYFFQESQILSWLISASLTFGNLLPLLCNSLQFSIISQTLNETYSAWLDILNDYHKVRGYVLFF